MQNVPKGWVRIGFNLIECPKSGDIMSFVAGLGWVVE